MNHKGMSLIEIIFVLSILCISASLAIPSFAELIQNNRLKSAALQLEQDLRLAKLTANQKKTRVSLCIAKDQYHCVTESTYDWHQGWILFVDSDNTFIPKPENILRYRPAFHSDLQITSSYNIQHGLQFNSGKKFGRSLGTGLTNGYFMLCNRHKKAHKFIINIYGRTRKDSSVQNC